MAAAGEGGHLRSRLGNAVCSPGPGGISATRRLLLPSR